MHSIIISITLPAVNIVKSKQQYSLGKNSTVVITKKSQKESFHHALKWLRFNVNI